VIDLDDFPLPLPATSDLPVPTLRRLGVMPVLAANDHLVVAMSNPADREVTALGFLTSDRVVPVLASARAIHVAFSRTYDRVEDEALVRHLGLDAIRDGTIEVVQVEAERLARERPVVKMVADLIKDAIDRRASDIHIRPGAGDVELLYRIDGELVTVRRFLRPLLPALVSRIKVMGGMNIAEHRVPQDGRVSVSEGGSTVDLRISMLPTVYGEAVVLRLLNTHEGLRKLEEIGFSAADQQRFSDLLVRGHGMILATGPTGCGKSTTLYSALLEIRKQNVNIVTVEDPVEYRIPDIEQIQVNRAAGTTFAATLRNILRHDPDVIMVGEIRDRETAEIAVESALTGHLVLSTLHTSSAATTVTRLLDLGIEAFLLRSTLLAALAQRLARRNCPQCLTTVHGDAHMRQVMGCSETETFKLGAGCSACEGTGVHGRVAVYELLLIDAGVRRLIQKGADAETIHALGVKNGMRPITEHALALARAGTIPLSEAFRIRVE
jgi:type II secretory ATPase GspE/PulE/Tfp pilus assembly ATPase PilB-like protein